MSALFPVVPIGPGIPSVLRSGLNIVNNVTLLIADAQLLFAQAPKWGIYNSQGAVAIKPDSFISYGVKRDWRVADYPIEEGGFASYDKVRTPPIVRLTVTKGGVAVIRKAFLNTLDVLSNSLDLLTIQIPEGKVGPFTIDHYDFDRHAKNGVELLTVDIWFKYIKVVQAAAFQNTAQPSGANAVNGGTSQTQPPSMTAPAVPQMASQVSSFGNGVTNMAAQLTAAGGPLSAIGSTLGYAGSQLTSLASPIASAASTALPDALADAGYLVCSTGAQIAQATALVQSAGGDLAATLLPQLNSLAGTSAQLSSQLLVSSETLATGGTLSAFTFNGPLPTIPGQSALGQALSSPAESVTAGNVTFGPVLPTRAQ